MITRVRIEASAKTEEGIQDDLVGAASFVQQTFGGEWEQELPMSIQHAGSGENEHRWGYYVLVRK